MKRKLKGELDGVDAIACTTDMWTSRTQVSYLTVTAHFLVGKELKSAVLDSKPVRDRHTGENIADALREILDDFGVSQKVVCFVTDNGANVALAIRLLGYRHLSCVAHTTNLAVKEALEAVDEVTDAINAAKHNVTHFRLVTFWLCRLPRNLYSVAKS